MRKIKMEELTRARNIPITKLILNDDNFEEYEAIEHFVKKNNIITEE